MGWMPAFPTFDRNPLDLADEAGGGRRRPGRARRRPSSRPAGWGSRSTIRARRRASRACSSSGARTCSARRARARSTSCATCSAPTHDGPLADPLPPGERPIERALARGDPARQARPAGQRRLPHDHDRAVLGRRAAGGDLVREVRPVDDRHAPVRAFVQPGGAAAVGGAHGLGRVRHDRARVLRRWPPSTSACAATSSRRRCCTTRPASSPSRAARWPTGGRASASRCPGARCPP